VTATSQHPNWDKWIGADKENALRIILATNKVDYIAGWPFWRISFPRGLIWYDQANSFDIREIMKNKAWHLASKTMHYHMQAKDAKNYDIKLKDIAQLVVEGQSV
jgi:hypothetical protein